MKYLSLTIPGIDKPIDSGLPGGVPVGGLFDDQGKVGGTGAQAITAFITLIVTLAILTSLWFMLKGGWDIITSRGHKETMQKGRERVLYALMGLIFIFLSFIMVGLANAFFGVDLLPFLFK